MRLNAVKILKISITNTSKKEILEEIQKYLTQNGKNRQKTLKIFTPNTEQLVYAANNPFFTDILNWADLAIPDTVGVVWAGHILTKNGPASPIPGVEFMEDLIDIAAKRHVPVGLIGGRGNLAVETLNCLQTKYPALAGWAADGPEVTIENSVLKVENEEEKIYFARLSRRIVREGTGIVFIALGPPKQEMFIEKLSSQLSVISQTDHRSPITGNSSIILMAVGGSFDILSGRLLRAPQWMRALGIEWFWRLILEPWRIFRQLSLIEFVWLVIREKFAASR